VFHFFINSPELPLALPTADDKVIGKAAHLSRIKQHNVTGLPFPGSVHGPAGYFNSFQNSGLPNFWYLKL
jgi:hypothetical protein